MVHLRSNLLAAVAILLCATLTACQTARSTASTSRTSVVLTTDCGADMDDQWALAHILLSPELDLKAVITSHASSIGMSSATTAKNALSVIATIVSPRQSSHAPSVIAGSSEPLHDAHTPIGNAGVDRLMRISRDFTSKHRLMVFIIGAGTDVASALLIDPSIADRIQIVAMGFDQWPQGGDGFNIKNDPFAWAAILDSRVPIAIGGTGVTKSDLRLTRFEGAALLRSHGRIGEYLYSIFDEWLTKRADLVAQYVAPETWVVWDEVVVAYALGMTHGDEVPRPKLLPDLSFAHSETNARITWITHIETEKFWRDFTRKIDDATQPAAAAALWIF